MITGVERQRPEHTLLCQLARSQAPPPGPTIVGPIDWDLLLDLAEAHGVRELLWRTVQASPCTVPSGILAKLKQHHVSATALNLRRATQLAALRDRFQEQGIDVLTFKGPTFAIGIYGDLGLRISSDLDLLVRYRDATQVRPMLLAEGYRLLPRPRHRVGSLVYGLVPSTGRSDTLVPDDPRLASVDIHLTFAHWTQGIRLDTEAMFRRAVVVTLAGQPVPTMCPDDLLLVLAIHGMMHNWHHLRFVSDIEAVARHVRDWRAVAHRAKAAGMRRVLWVALLLGHDLLAAPVPEDVLAEARLDAAAVAIAETAAAQLFEKHDGSASNFDPAKWQLSFQDGQRGRIRFHLRRWIYEWFLKWPWDEWLGRRGAPGSSGHT